MHTHRISLRSFGTTSASIVHATSAHHPSHQCPRLSISTPGNWRPCPPPAHTSPYFRLSLPLASSPLHRRPFLFWTPTPLSIGAHRSTDHRRPYCLSLIKVTFFIPFECCVSLVLVTGISTFFQFVLTSHITWSS